MAPIRPDQCKRCRPCQTCRIQRAHWVSRRQQLLNLSLTSPLFSTWCYYLSFPFDRRRRRSRDVVYCVIWLSSGSEEERFDTGLLNLWRRFASARLELIQLLYAMQGGSGSRRHQKRWPKMAVMFKWVRSLLSSNSIHIYTRLNKLFKEMSIEQLLLRIATSRSFYLLQIESGTKDVKKIHVWVGGWVDDWAMDEGLYNSWTQHHS